METANGFFTRTSRTGIKRSIEKALAVCGTAALAGALVAPAALAASGGDNNSGDVWVDTVGAPAGPGHEMDSHLPCADFNLWGSKMADASGPFALLLWPPTGSKQQVYSGTWHYAGSGTQKLATVSIQQLETGVVAAGGSPTSMHIRLNLTQDPGKHKMFWISCPTSAPVVAPPPPAPCVDTDANQADMEAADKAKGKDKDKDKGNGKHQDVDVADTDVECDTESGTEAAVATAPPPAPPCTEATMDTADSEKDLKKDVDKGQKKDEKKDENKDVEDSDVESPVCEAAEAETVTPPPPPAETVAPPVQPVNGVLGASVVAPPVAPVSAPPVIPSQPVAPAAPVINAPAAGGVQGANFAAPVVAGPLVPQALTPTAGVMGAATTMPLTGRPTNFALFELPIPFLALGFAMLRVSRAMAESRLGLGAGSIIG